MPAVTRVNVRLLTYMPPSSCQTVGLVAGESIAIGEACYIKSDGTVWRSLGSAADAAAKVRGFTAVDVDAGDPCPLFYDVVLRYSSGMTAGTDLYLSGTNAGWLDDAPSTGGIEPVAYVLNGSDIAIMRSRY